MIKQLKSILKNPTLPDWKDADEIVPRVWLGTMTDSAQARYHNIAEVICISKEPHADLHREGFRQAPDLDSTLFTIDSDTEGDLLSIFSKVCDAIDGTLQEDESVLVWDIGGGVAAVAAYLMRSYRVVLAEAMTAITHARFKKAKPTLLPSRRIIDLLQNETYQRQLDMWQACEYDIYENTVVNPSEPREKWIIGKVDDDSTMMMKKKKMRREALLPILKRTGEQLPLLSEQPHRLSTIEEMEEEAKRLSTIYEEKSGGWTLPSAYCRP